jgi:hypothetical protein
LEFCFGQDIDNLGVEDLLSSYVSTKNLGGKIKLMKISASPRKEASWTDELQNMKQDVISKSRNSLEPEIPVLTLYFYCNVNIDFLFHIL